MKKGGPLKAVLISSVNEIESIGSVVVRILALK